MKHEINLPEGLEKDLDKLWSNSTVRQRYKTKEKLIVTILETSIDDWIEEFGGETE